MSPAGYCTLRLSGAFSINTGDAGLFYPYEYQRECWDFDLAEAIGVPADKYAQIYRSHEPVGTVTDAAAEETGLRIGTDGGRRRRHQFGDSNALLTKLEG